METIRTDFKGRYGPCALILGGSEGIGEAFARQLAANGLDLILVARTADRLEATAAGIRANWPVLVQTLAIDLSSTDAADHVHNAIGAVEIGLVICNAGATHGAGLFLDQPAAHAAALLQLNCLTPLHLLHALLGPMRERRRGGAILVSSTSGLAGSGLTAAYAASKAFVLSFAEGLHTELAGAGVDILCAVAGLTDTPAMARSGLRIEGQQTYVPMASDQVAEAALAALGRQPIWYAVGDAAAAAMRSMPREELSRQMTAGAASLYGLPDPGAVSEP